MGAYEALYDPWKQAYHYERDRLDRTTGVPQIWSEGADPDDPNGKIANWPQPPFWRRVYDNLFFYGFLLFTVVAVVMVCATSKYWNERELQGWVVFLLVALAVGWVTYFGWLTSTSVLAGHWRAQGKDARHSRVRVASRFVRIAYQIVARGQVFRHPTIQGRH
jgi:hypothetical protein